MKIIVLCQGSIIDRIDYNIYVAERYISKGNIELFRLLESYNKHAFFC